MAPFHPTIQPKVHIPDMTHPTFYCTTSLQCYCGASCAPPSISSEPPLRTEPLPGPPHGVMTPGIIGLSVVTGWEKQRPDWVDVAWPAMRVYVARQRKGGLTSLTWRGRRRPPLPPPGSGKATPPPPQGDTGAPPPPPKAPRTGTPAERAERDRPRGGVDECVEQQQQQRATWEVRAISVEAAHRDVEARVSKAKEDRRAAEAELAAVRRDKDRLAARVKTLERDLAAARRATGGRPPGQTGEDDLRAQRPRGGWGRPIPPAFVSCWPGRRHGMRRLRLRRDGCRPSPWLRMALLTSGQAVEVAHVVPNVAVVTPAHEELGRRYPPPNRLTAAAMDASVVEAVEHSS